jgi:hypothetical protein
MLLINWYEQFGCWICEYCDFAHEDYEEMVEHICPGPKAVEAA